jgi:hypothetical protein
MVPFRSSVTCDESSKEDTISGDVSQSPHNGDYCATGLGGPRTFVARGGLQLPVRGPRISGCRGAWSGLTGLWAPPFALLTLNGGSDRYRAHRIPVAGGLVPPSGARLAARSGHLLRVLRRHAGCCRAVRRHGWLWRRCSTTRRTSWCWTCLVNPYDPESVAGALAQALAMPLEERRARHEAAFANVCEYDVDRWQREFLKALRGDDDGVLFGSRSRVRSTTRLNCCPR